MYNGRFAVTARIFNMIDGFSPEKQFMLYKDAICQFIDSKKH
jgi:hypothetical protein